MSLQFREDVIQSTIQAAILNAVNSFSTPELNDYCSTKFGQSFDSYLEAFILDKIDEKLMAIAQDAKNQWNYQQAIDAINIVESRAQSYTAKIMYIKNVLGDSRYHYFIKELSEQISDYASSTARIGRSFYLS